MEQIALQRWYRSVARQALAEFYASEEWIPRRQGNSTDADFCALIHTGSLKRKQSVAEEETNHRECCRLAKRAHDCRRSEAAQLRASVARLEHTK
jgi:hypothetical protein